MDTQQVCEVLRNAGYNINVESGRRVLIYTGKKHTCVGYAEPGLGTFWVHSSHRYAGGYNKTTARHGRKINALLREAELKRIRKEGN